MRSFRWHTFWRSLRRRLIASIVLLAYLAATIGFPLSAPAGKDHRQRYPCENHPCGCRNAEDCWRHCCCTTPEERWAWARANGVEPPPYADRPASERQQTPPGRAHSRGKCHRACCHNHQDKAECSAASQEGCSSCHGKACSRNQDELAEAEPDDQSPLQGGVHWVSGIGSLKCRGVSTLWITSGAVLPPPPAVAWRAYLRPVGWVSCHYVSLLPSTVPPPDPPPRRS
jgi:hypothetical protein